MVTWLHIGPDFLYATVWPDEKRYAVRAHIFPTQKTFLAPHSVSLHNAFVFIRQQSEWELIFRGELRV